LAHNLGGSHPGGQVQQHAGKQGRIN
jgi:hypothetical protein